MLYRDSRRKFKKAVRGAMVLAFLVLFLLAANCGLVFAVVYLTKVLHALICIHLARAANYDHHGSFDNRQGLRL